MIEKNTKAFIEGGCSRGHIGLLFLWEEGSRFQGRLVLCVTLAVRLCIPQTREAGKGERLQLQEQVNATA